MPKRIDENSQPLPLTIRNISPKPVSGKGRVELTGPGGEKLGPLEVPFGPVGPGQTADVEFAVKGLKLVNSSWKVAYRVVADRIAVTADARPMTDLLFAPKKD